MTTWDAFCATCGQPTRHQGVDMDPGSLHCTMCGTAGDPMPMGHRGLSGRYRRI